MLVAAWTVLELDLAAQQLEQPLEALRAGRGDRLQQLAVGRAPPTAGCLSSSRERRALAKACLKVRPIAIASPTERMWVESVGSVPGNFSKANRGHLTTT